MFRDVASFIFEELPHYKNGFSFLAIICHVPIGNVRKGVSQFINFNLRRILSFGVFFSTYFFASSFILGRVILWLHRTFQCCFSFSDEGFALVVCAVMEVGEWVM